MESSLLLCKRCAPWQGLLLIGKSIYYLTVWEGELRSSLESLKQDRILKGDSRFSFVLMVQKNSEGQKLFSLNLSEYGRWWGEEKSLKQSIFPVNYIGCNVLKKTIPKNDSMTLQIETKHQTASKMSHCGKTWQPETNPHVPHSRWRKQTSAGSPLLIHTGFCGMHLHMYILTHVPPHRFVVYIFICAQEDTSLYKYTHYLHK